MVISAKANALMAVIGKNLGRDKCWKNPLGTPAQNLAAFQAARLLMPIIGMNEKVKDLFIVAPLKERPLIDLVEAELRQVVALPRSITAKFIELHLRVCLSEMRAARLYEREL
jgi:hypothetical protein